MQSFREPAVQTPPQVKISLPFSADLAVSLASAPLLLALVSGRAAAYGLAQLGQSSEELFRGDRLPSLPLLPLPDQSSAEP